MNHTLTLLTALLLAPLAVVTELRAAENAAGMPVVKTLDDCNVVWDSPSADSLGSMPLGNGDVGANVWVEPSGDVVFYVSKVDAYNAQHLLPKLGCVRLRFTPALATTDFEQKLTLRDAAIAINAGDVKLRVWVDASAPVIRVTGESGTPVDAVASFETTRDCSEQDDKADRLAWGYRNTTSAWMDRVRNQNTPEFAAKVVDPILNRTSGCRLSGEKFVRDGKRALRLQGTRTIGLTVRVLSSQTPTLAEWFAELEKPVASDWVAHQKWWQAFWERSYIRVEKCGDAPEVLLDQYRFTQFPQASRAYRGHDRISSATNAFQITQRYALERFCEAVASRGVVPPPYNGSIFTMDLPAGAQSFAGPRKQSASADSRDWGALSFMWQNTRHPYWAMATRGDYDTLLPGMKFVRDGLDVCRDRCKNIFHHDGAFIMEASWWHNVGVFNYPRIPGHLRYHFLASIELPAIMCEYYEHTGDKKFLNDILLPCADEFVKFYELQFPKRDARGKMIMEPAGTVETYQPVTNPATEISGLRYLLTKLASFDTNGRWTKLLGELPDVPLRVIKGVTLLAPGEKYLGREICETPEMYAVYPFRQAWLGNDALLAAARQSLHLRAFSLDGTDDKQPVETGGWQSSPVQAAYLGLAREAARLVSINYNDQFIHWTGNVDPDAPWPTRPRARFPAFWETKMDYTPDNDHGANSANALQSMLLQSDGQKMFLLPAWPEDWDVSFKLHAAHNTTVECEYRDGKVQSLKVDPPSRRADIIDMTTLENRIQTLIAVACADRNYLFGLPPMLDAQPKPGKTTGPWLAQYGESVTGVRAAPWPGCVFRDNIIYVHGSAAMPPMPVKLISSNRLSSAILKLEYDRPIEPLALAAPSRGSLTAGKTGTDICFDKPVTFDRIEFTIENPGYRYGQAKPFELQVQQADGTWQAVHKGRVFGSIYSKKFDPLTAQHIRLIITGAPVVRQFDLFNSAAAITLTAPLDYQVIQRMSRTAGTVHFRGALLDLDTSRARLEARIVENGKPGQWQGVEAKFSQRNFEGTLVIPAGGWYQVEVRVVLDGEVAADAAVEHVGVGEVFVVAGQSNSANFGEVKQVTKSRRVAAFAGNTWQIADDPQPGAGGKGGSFMPPLGDELVQRFNVPVGFIACGIGATSVREWLPRGTKFPNPPTLVGRVQKNADGAWESKGQAFETFVTRMKQTGPRGFRAVLWHQGESDANQKDPTRTLPGGLYREYLEKLIRDSRREIGWEAPWFVAQVSYHVPGDEASPDIRAAQASLWRDGIALAGPDTDALKGELRQNDGKGVHFSDKGLNMHAAKWAEKICPWLERELTGEKK